MAGPFPLPPITISTLLREGRALLLDPTTGPQVPSPGQGLAVLQDVRVRGDSKDSAGVQVGTIGWNPADTPRPWGVLTAYKKRLTYRETYHAWEDWDCSFHLALAMGDYDLFTSEWTWAQNWDAELTQWFAGHRRFGDVTTQGGDVFWQYEGGEIRPFQIAGVVAFGLVCTLRVHNVVSVTWGV